MESIKLFLWPFWCVVLKQRLADTGVPEADELMPSDSAIPINVSSRPPFIVF